MRERVYQFIGAASCWGAQVRTCEDGPEAIHASGLLEELKKQHVPVHGWETLHPKLRFKDKDIPLKDALPLIIDINNRLADRVIEAMQQGHFPVVIGGDHSLAIGTWNGVFSPSQKPLGLIWIDAHMDSHTDKTTPSGAWHGMPLAALLGHGRKELTRVKRDAPILLPQHLCLIGIHSFEPEEAELLERLKVRIYFIDEVKKRGFQEVLREAIAHVSKGTAGYGVSLDVDSVDPLEAPGVGSPEKGGIHAKELLKGLALLSIDPHLKAFELVEFNPHRDDGKTLKLCQKILTTVLYQGKNHG